MKQKVAIVYSSNNQQQTLTDTQINEHGITFDKRNRFSFFFVHRAINNKFYSNVT